MHAITLTEVKAAVHTFETTDLIPLSNAWDELRHAMHEAITLYAAQNNMSRADVAKELKL